MVYNKVEHYNFVLSFPALFSKNRVAKVPFEETRIARVEFQILRQASVPQDEFRNVKVAA